MRIGILALQGAVQDHEAPLRRLGAETRQVRLPSELEGLDGLVLPGGESTVMAMYLAAYGLDAAIRAAWARGLALFGLCAGAILLCEEVDGRAGALRLLPAAARRNAYGRQLSSFEEEVEVALGGGAAMDGRSLAGAAALPAAAGRKELFPGVFIRAPRLEPRGAAETIGRRLSRGAEAPGEPVLLRSGRVLGASFHPELTGDDRIHRFFLEAVVGS